VELDGFIRPQKITIYRGGTLRGGRRLGIGAPIALGGKKPGLWAGPTSHRRRPSGL
jgi:hypothetical protein